MIHLLLYESRLNGIPFRKERQEERPKGALQE